MVTTDLIVQSSLTPVAFSLVLALVLGAAHRAWRQQYLACWAGYWGLYVVAWPCAAVFFWADASRYSGLTSIAGITCNSVAYTARGLLLLGTAMYMGWKQPSKAQLRLIAAVLVVLAVAGELVRLAATSGRLPGWAALPFRTFFLGGLVHFAAAFAVLRSRRPQPVPRAVLFAALLVSGGSDAWDFFAELMRGPEWTDSLAGLRISLFVSQLTDSLCAAGMLVAAIGTESERAERAIAAVKTRDEQLDRVKRLEIVGRLAGGLAHDFNNLLTVIVGTLDFLRARLPAGDEAVADVDCASMAATRAAKLTRQLLTFARQQRVEPRVIDLGSVLRSLDRMLAVLAGERIERDLRIGKDLWPVAIDPTQFEQLIVNLVVNAHDAMTRGGTLRIGAENVVIGREGRPADAARVPDGDWVQLVVEDTGEGMTEEVQKRIFEPFFTTKPAGKGTGLGLASVYGIVQQAGAHIAVVSAPAKGTRFSIWFPRERSHSPCAARCVSRAPSGNEKVLLVENEPMVRRVAARQLEAGGYRVIQAESGDEALRLPIDDVALVVSDVVMADMDGWELVRRLRDRRGKLPALFMSGFVPDGPHMPAANEGPSAFLGKPFTPEQFIGRIRALIESAKTS
jgi:signal transduction histidine kinase